MASYVPNPNFYDDDIKKLNSEIEDLNTVSYDSKKRGYVVGGKTYTSSQLDKLIKDKKAKVKQLEADKKKYGRYGPSVGDQAKSNAAGEEFLRLYNEAAAIDVKDFDSAVANYEAWKKVSDFVKSNKNIVAVVKREVTLKGENGRDVTRLTNIAIDPTKDSRFKSFLTESPKQADQFLDRFAEQGTIRTETIIKGNGPSATRSTRKVVTNQAELDRRNAVIDNLRSGKTATATQTGPTGATGPTGPTTTTTTGAKVTGPTGAKTTGPTAPKTTTTTKKTTTTPSRPAAGGGTTVVVDGEKVKVGGQRWQQIIQQEFGSLWDVYNGNADVKKVIDQSVKEGWFNDETKLTASLTNTGWFRTTQQSARQFAIRQSTDPATLDDEINQEVEGLRASTTATGITLDDNTLRKLATDKIKFGWSAQQLSNAIGSEAIATAQLGGAQGIADLRSGVVGRNLRQKAAAYAQKPSDSQIDTWIQQIMRGEKSETQWEDLMRDSAKTQFRSLQPALDKGQDVETALYAYKQQAQATLGSAVDMSEIDWTSDKWNKALNYRDPKTNEYRQMDLWEWNKYLRSLPEWQNTDQAKDIYRNVAMGLAQGFGKMA